MNYFMTDQLFLWQIRDSSDSVE